MENSLLATLLDAGYNMILAELLSLYGVAMTVKCLFELQCIKTKWSEMSWTDLWAAPSPLPTAGVPCRWRIMRGNPNSWYTCTRSPTEHSPIFGGGRSSVQWLISPCRGAPWLWAGRNGSSSPSYCREVEGVRRGQRGCLPCPSPCMVLLVFADTTYVWTARISVCTHLSQTQFMPSLPLIFCAFQSGVFFLLQPSTAESH